MLARKLLGAKKGSLLYVGGKSAAIASSVSSSNSVPLSGLSGGIGTSAAIGDLVIVAFATGSNQDRTLSITTGYTLIGSELYANASSTDSNLRVAYKRLTAVDANVTIGPTQSSNDSGAVAIHVWRGTNATTPIDVTPTTATGTTGGQPNPPSITPVTAGAVIICAGGSAFFSGNSTFTSGLSNFQTAAEGTPIYKGNVGMGSFAWTSGAYDAAAFGGGAGGSGNYAWTAISFAIRPA